MIHVLKCWPEIYKDFTFYDKKFDVRKNDRDFKVNDILHICEWNKETKKYTGYSRIMRVTYIMQGGQFGVKLGYCVMGLSDLFSGTFGFTNSFTPPTIRGFKE